MAGGDSAAAKAEVLFKQAIAVAQGQRAALWELRAANSLAKLRRDTKRLDEARTVLAAAYGRFTEGLDAPDLVEARQLLSELNGAVEG